MIEVKAEISDISVNFKNNKCRVTFEYDGKPEQAEQLSNNPVRLMFKKWAEKRSLKANAYCWKLCTEIANVLTLQGAPCTKDEIYEHALKSYGQSDIVTIRSDINPERFFEYFEEKGKGTIKGVEYTHYKVTVGSSQYSSFEMSVLLRGNGLERHEIFYGSLYRQRSIEDGLFVFLTPEQHKGFNGIHGSGEKGDSFRKELKQLGQQVAMDYYGWTIEEFRNRYGKNYL